MPKKTGKAGFVVHVLITIIGVAGAFFAGSKLSGSGQGEVDKLLGELRSDIDGNVLLIDANTKLGVSNKRSAADSLRKVTALSYSVTRMNTEPAAGLASSGKGMPYLNKVMGLKWVTRPSDRHRYCQIPYPLPWHSAQEFAEKVGGSLVVIGDATENKWIVDTFGDETEFWIGLTDEVEEGKWLWINDQDLLYKNWATGEPDNYRKTQHHVIKNKQAATGAAQPGKWNDVVCNEIKIAIIEIGG
jgi:hypothetical protein